MKIAAATRIVCSPMARDCILGRHRKNVPL
jgi:hypothetical protein